MMRQPASELYSLAIAASRRMSAPPRSASRYQVSISPLPFTWIVPRGSQTNSSLISS